MNKDNAKLFQRALRELVKPSLVVDGNLGEQSLSAFKAYAEIMNYPKPLDFLPSLVYEAVMRYAAQRFITSENYEACAQRLSVPQSYVRAIADVESGGGGFLNDGRVSILFERHWFYKKIREALLHEEVQLHVAKILKTSISTTDNRVVRAATLLSAIVSKFPNICSTTRGGYLGGANEYSRLEIAERLDPEAAYQATSFGCFQIMGFNCRQAGYATAQDMLLAYSQGEGEHLNSLSTFIINNKGLHVALRIASWSEFARLYNGPAYMENKYDLKLIMAQAKYQVYDK